MNLLEVGVLQLLGEDKKKTDQEEGQVFLEEKIIEASSLKVVRTKERRTRRDALRGLAQYSHQRIQIS